MEQEIIAFITNQGLAVALSAFLVWWVTSQVSKVLEKIANRLDDHDRRTVSTCDRVDGMCDKVEAIYDAVVK